MIGKRIQTLRMKQGISLTELARRAGVSKSYLSNIEREIQSNPSIHFLSKLSKVLNTDLQNLLSPYEDG